MKLPARFVAGNLIWARDGGTWAVFRVEPVSYPWLAHHEKLAVHQRTQGALVALPLESMVLSLCTPLPADELRDRMTPPGLPTPGLQRLVHLALRAVQELCPTRRHCFLVARLPDEGRATGLALPGSGSARSGMAEVFGLPPRSVGPAEVARRAAQAHQILGRLQGSLTLRAATAGEVCWIHQAAILRGLPIPAATPAARDPLEPVRAAHLVALADAAFSEGGRPDDAGRPVHRRYLRVESEAGTAYQALIALSDMPHRFGFPDGGGEWLTLPDTSAFAVDWCVRIRPVANRVAQASARRQARHLHSQTGEYEGDPAGAPAGLGEAMAALGDLRRELAAHPAGSELQVTTIMAVGAPGLADLEDRVRSLRCQYQGGGYDLHRPIGGQLGLFVAMLPGAPVRSPARDYVHHLLGRDLAAGMPFGAGAVGDPEGMLLGYSRDAGTFRPVLFDPGYGPRINRSASLGAFGALGSGKSYFIKSVVHATLARGGRVVALDRTAMGEYVRLAAVTPGTVQVVTLAAGADVCLDPLRVFAGEERITTALGFLSMVTASAPASPAGVALAEAVQAVAGLPGGGLADVLDRLEAAGASDPDANGLWRVLRSAARSPLGRLAFGRGTTVSLAADYLVFHAPGLALPERDVALREHLNLPEHILSQGLLYLLAALCRHITFSDRGRFAAALFDEAWCLTASLQGRSLLLDAVRDGRKHNAAVWLVSQHPQDLGDDELAHLLGPRFVFRQSAAAAPAALRFVGVEPSQRAVDFLSSAGEGTCLMRDVRDRVGAVQVLPALSGQFHAAFQTNPLEELQAP